MTGRRPCLSLVPKPTLALKRRHKGLLLELRLRLREKSLPFRAPGREKQCGTDPAAQAL